MLISHRRRFIYTKTLKTAGTSVEVYFEQFCMPPGQWRPQQERSEYVSPTGIIGRRTANPKGYTWYNHMPAAEIRDKVGADIWKHYFKFCVIRNPFDKLVSAFFFQFRDRDWSVTDPVPLFREWAKSGRYALDRDKYTIKGKPCLDDHIRFETLHEDLDRVCGILGVPYDPRQLPLLKAGFRQTSLPVAAFYDRETIEIVSEKFAFELEYFGYAPPAAA